MEIKFNSLEELYIRVKPALFTKKQELVRSGYDYIVEEDIWNCLKEEKWPQTTYLTLYQMIDDILNLDNMYLEHYLKSKLKKSRRFRYYGSEDEFYE